ncbi:mitochondrial carrier superfamily protein [Toxoplasma gondii ARI]|uniref:Mitochondrial carrier superfamily protein n=1 Tax=Toxoplasma gondii ARI TaxID=1074872 RepID=A0A139XMP6_TOXGO|nr:mitochondrial carrier superfamily protein [Toxoplasma gondii ARI]
MGDLWTRADGWRRFSGGGRGANASQELKRRGDAPSRRQGASASLRGEESNGTLSSREEERDPVQPREREGQRNMADFHVSGRETNGRRERSDDSLAHAGGHLHVMSFKVSHLIGSSPSSPSWYSASHSPTRASFPTSPVFLSRLSASSSFVSPLPSASASVPMSSPHSRYSSSRLRTPTDVPCRTLRPSSSLSSSSLSSSSPSSSLSSSSPSPLSSLSSSSPSPLSSLSSSPRVSGTVHAARARRFWVTHPTEVAAAVCADAAASHVALCREKGRRGERDSSEGGETAARAKKQQQTLLVRWFTTDAGLHLTSGAIAGAVSRTATAPLDRIKVVLQLQRGEHLSLSQAVRRIRTHESEDPRAKRRPGWTGFFRGNLTNCVKVMPETAIKFYAYDFIKQRLLHFKQEKEQNACNAASLVAAVTREERAKAARGGSSEQPDATGAPSTRRREAPSPKEEAKEKKDVASVGKDVGADRELEDIFERQRRRPTSEKEDRSSGAHRSSEGMGTGGGCPSVPAVSLTLFDKLLCGAAAGMIAQFTIYPMEIVKTRLAAYSPLCRYDGILDCLVKTFKEGGLRRLYRGLGPSLLGIIPYASIDLALFDTLKGMYVSLVLLPKLLSEEEREGQAGRERPRRLGEELPSQPNEQRSCVQSSSSQSSPSSSISSSSSSSRSPSSLPSSGAASHPPSASCLVSESAREASAAPLGPASLCARTSCASSDPHEAHKKAASPNVFVLLFCGCVSSLCGQVVAYPTALVRTRIQVDGGDGQPPKYKNSWGAARCAWSDGGVRGLYRGLCANLMKAVPAVSVSWLVYEKSKEAIRRSVEVYEANEIRS